MPGSPSEVMQTEAERKFASIFKSTGEGIIYASREGRVVDVNPALERITGMSREAIVGKSGVKLARSLLSARDLPPILKFIRRSLAGESDVSLELEFRGRWLEIRTYREQALEGLIAIIRDVTQRKRAELALKKSERKFASIFNSAGDGIIYMDRTGRVEEVNPALTTITGIPREELVGRSALVLARTFLKGKFLRTVLARIRDVLASRTIKTYEIEFRGKTLELRSFQGPGMSGMIAILRDVTEQRLAQKGMYESQERFRTLTESLADAVFAHRLDGRLVMVNRVACENTGYTREELLGMSVADIDAESLDRGDRRRYWLDLKLGERATIDASHRRKNGSLYPAEIHLIRIELGGQPVILGVARDISVRRQAEEEIKASLREKEILLKEIHHRVKNNLQIIVSLINLQSERIRDPEALAAFAESKRRIISMALVHEKLYKSRDYSQINFQDYTRAMIREMMRSYRTSRRISLDLDVEDLTMGIDKAIPCGLIINELVSNALKHAFPEKRKGRIRVSLHCRDHGRCRCRVEDDGVGIPPEVDLGNRDSLGLMLVDILAAQIGGSIILDREPTTRFTIQFPI